MSKNSSRLGILENFSESHKLNRNHGVTQNILKMSEGMFSHIVKKWIAGKVSSVRAFLKGFDKIQFDFGTKEWAHKNFNTHNGCLNACWNCYAWKDVYRYKQPYWKNWDSKMLLRKNWDKRWKKRPDGYWIMYPSRHDVLQGMENYAFRAIQNMLDANINVLFVSKPHLEVIKHFVNKMQTSF